MDLNFDELKQLEMDKLQEDLQKSLDDHKAKVSEMKDIDELSKLELEIDDKQKEFDDYLRTAEYELAESIEFEGKSYTKADVARRIIYHLNRVEQDFQYCLGLHGLVLFWKNIAQHDKISYGTYDSTLRVLGGLKFKGDNEWTDILTINNYMAGSHDPYLKDRVIMLTMAEMRNEVVNRMQLVSKEVSE